MSKSLSHRFNMAPASQEMESRELHYHLLARWVSRGSPHPMAANSLVTRGRKLWTPKFHKEIYNRRLIAGPEPERPRSAWTNWNYEAELFAFGKRLGEDFSKNTLRTAFTQPSYAEAENTKQDELGLDGIHLEDNSELSESGKSFSESYIKAYLRHCYPALPEDGIGAIMEWLMREEMLAYVASNLGITDLVLDDEFPVPQNKVANTLLAIIGGLLNDQGAERASLFVQDFLITQLIGKNLNELWELVNPMGRLSDILTKQGRSLPEPRLLWETGSETLFASYMVGIYVDKKLIGKGYGETVSIAEEMAAKDCLGRMFGLTLHSPPLPFGEAGKKLSQQINET